jgi:hypothetical protein
MFSVLFYKVDIGQALLVSDQDRGSGPTGWMMSMTTRLILPGYYQ